MEPRFSSNAKPNDEIVIDSGQLATSHKAGELGLKTMNAAHGC
jgi:hypothetical protein